jgi:hypothetical protein
VPETHAEPGTLLSAALQQVKNPQLPSESLVELYTTVRDRVEAVRPDRHSQSTSHVPFLSLRALLTGASGDGCSKTLHCMLKRWLGFQLGFALRTFAPRYLDSAHTAIYQFKMMVCIAPSRVSALCYQATVDNKTTLWARLT